MLLRMEQAALCPDESEHTFIFDLAPDGVWHDAKLRSHPVRSYRTFSPFPPINRGRFVFCSTFRYEILTNSIPAIAPVPRNSDGAVPCGVRTFLIFDPISRKRKRDYLVCFSKNKFEYI